MQGCQVGIGRVEITPRVAGACAGWSIAGPDRVAPPSHADQALVATALALQDPTGERVVLVNADLHCGSAPLWRALGQVEQLGGARLILCGTHTHQGPGQRYGSVLYSLGTTPRPLSVGRSTRRLRPLLVGAVREALGSLEPGGVAVTRAVVRGASSNRAVPAWRHFDDAAQRQFLEEGPGRLVRADAPLADRLCDPRLTALVARRDDGSLIGALAWFAVHGTALGPGWTEFGADLWGPARRVFEAEVGCAVGFGGGASGDVSPLPLTEGCTAREDGGPRPHVQGVSLAEHVGHAVGNAAVEAVGSAVAEAFTLSVAHEVWRPVQSGLPRPRLGAATAGGGIDGPTRDWDRLNDGVRAPGYAARADRAFPTSHPQGPKLDMAAQVAGVAVPFGPLGALFGPRALPLHVVRVGDHTFATTPGEPSTMVGWRIERAVQKAAGTGSASIIGYAGDYAGYWVSAEAYLEQRYEGASTLFGREASKRLTERLGGLASRCTLGGAGDAL